MNHSTYSPECYNGMHSACAYEDCACRCHLYDRLERPIKPEPEPEYAHED